MSDAADTTLVEITSEVVSAYLAQNDVPPAEIPALIASVHATFATIGNVPEPAAAEPEKRTPAVPIRKSVTDEYIISLEDGRRFRSMKRYLSTLGMTADQYRAKWGLPADYPMVAPAYAKQRSALARAMNFGKRAGGEALPEPDEVLAPPVVPEMRKLKRPTP